MRYQIHNPQRVEQELGKTWRKLEKLQLALENRKRDVVHFEAAVLSWTKAHRVALQTRWNDEIVTTLIHSAVSQQYNAAEESLAQARADIAELETELALLESIMEHYRDIKANLEEAELCAA